MYVTIKPIEAEDGLGEGPTNGIHLINPLSVHAGGLCIVLDSRTGLRERKMICINGLNGQSYCLTLSKNLSHCLRVVSRVVFFNFEMWWYLMLLVPATDGKDVQLNHLSRGK